MNKDTDYGGVSDGVEDVNHNGRIDPAELDPNDPSDAAKDCNGDGYTNIEKYINGLDPRKKVDWKDLRNNRDPLLAAR